MKGKLKQLMPALADHEVVTGSAQAAAEPAPHRCPSWLPWHFPANARGPDQELFSALSPI